MLAAAQLIASETSTEQQQAAGAPAAKSGPVSHFPRGNDIFRD